MKSKQDLSSALQRHVVTPAAHHHHSLSLTPFKFLHFALNRISFLYVSVFYGSGLWDVSVENLGLLDL